MQKIDALNVDPYLRPLTDATVGTRCTEDRWYDLTRGVVGPQVLIEDNQFVIRHDEPVTINEALGMQMPGNETVPVLTTLEVQEPGSIINSGYTADQWSQALNEALGTLHHDNCLGWLARHTIAGTIAADDPVLRAKIAATGLVPSNSYDAIVGATQRLRAGIRMEASKETVQRNGASLIPLARIDGETPEHAAPAIALITASEGDKVLLDTRAAWEAGRPLYGANVGLYAKRAELLNRILQPLFDRELDPELFALAATSFVGAASENLPEVNGHRPKLLII